MLTDEPTGRLPLQIGSHSSRIRELCGQIAGRINEVRSLVATPRVHTADQVKDVCLSMHLDMIGLLSELNGLDSCVAAARMTGQSAVATVAKELELHPAYRDDDRERQLMIRSLHRAGDHTQDREDDAE